MSYLIPSEVESPIVHFHSAGISTCYSRSIRVNSYSYFRQPYLVYTNLHWQLGPLGLGVVAMLWERYWLHNLLHCILGSCLDHALANISEGGLPNVPFLQILLLAIKYRTALKTIRHEFVKAKQVLADLLRLSCPLSHIYSNNLATLSWDTPFLLLRSSLPRPNESVSHH